MVKFTRTNLGHLSARQPAKTDLKFIIFVRRKQIDVLNFSRENNILQEYFLTVSNNIPTTINSVDNAPSRTFS